MIFMLFMVMKPLQSYRKEDDEGGFFALQHSADQVEDR